MHRTVRLKLNTNPEQAQVLKQTLMEVTAAFNYLCEYGWNHNEKNVVKLQHACYYPLKKMCPGIVSDLIIQTIHKAKEAISSAFTKRKHGRKTSQPHSNLCSARYNLHTYKMNWQIGMVNLATSPGNRQKITFSAPSYASKYLGYPVDTAELLYRKGSFWLHVVVNVPTPNCIENGDVVGVDLGLTHPAVTSTRRFLGNRHWKEVERRNFRLKRSLQSKGTKAAKRHLKRLSGKVQRFRKDCDHVLSKRIVQSCTSGTTLVIENLTEIRKHARLRKGDMQRRLHNWSFAQLRSFLTYKAEEAIMRVVAIDPRYTSQTCSRCGYKSRSNRPKQNRFHCKECLYQLNADLNASYNIRDKHLANLGISLVGGPQSIGLSSQVSA